MQSFKKVSEKRTQIYLPQDTYVIVKKIAEERGVSIAQVVREAIEEKIEPRVKIVKSSWNQVMKLSGSIKRGPKDMSRNISKYVRKVYRSKE